ncbi:ADP-ribosyltransferase, partial [Bacillus mycoides]|uniref:anthrax toxin lethal factor-related metalloendopeptidase n=1 Tax=Bacillus mycoides TaxID=1405 RepID=UPI002E2379B6
FNTYAPGMFDYFDKLDWEKLKEQIQEKEQDVKENIKQEQDVKKWAEKYYKKWTGSLTSKQKESLNELKNPASENYNINLLLKYTDGDVNRRPMDASLESTKRYKEDIEAIDQALSNPAGKTTKKIDVYTDMDLFDLNNMDEKELIDPMNPNKIDREKLKIFKANFTYGLSSNYLIADLHEKQSGNNGILKWHIELPAGTNTGYLGNNQLVLQRNTGLEIGEVQVINQQGKEYIRINAKLVNKDAIDKKILMAQSKLNQSWNGLLKLPANTEFFKFEVNNRYASSITEGALPTIHEMMSNIPNNLVQKVAGFMLEKNGKFVLTDKFIRNIPEAYYPRNPTSEVLDRYDGSKGIFNEQNRTLIMSAPSTSIDGDHGMSARTLTHEFGHAVDYYIASIIGLKGRMACSDLPVFKDIFQKDGNNLTEYGKTNAQEFFADTFMMIYSNNPNERTEVLQKAPETFKFINTLIQEINSKDQSPNKIQ